MSKAVRDGILRVGKNAIMKATKQPNDEWFKLLGDNQMGELLRMYATVCNQRLAPYLTQVIQDRSFLDHADTSKQQQTPTASTADSMPPTPDGVTIKAEPAGTFNDWTNKFLICS